LYYYQPDLINLRISSASKSSQCHIGTLLGSYDVDVECTDNLSLQYKDIYEGIPMCIPTSCISDWESLETVIALAQAIAAIGAEGLAEMNDAWLSESLAAEGIDSGDVDCMINNLSVDVSSAAPGAGAFSAEPTLWPTAEPTLVPTAQPTREPTTQPSPAPAQVVAPPALLEPTAEPSPAAPAQVVAPPGSSTSGGATTGVAEDSGVGSSTGKANGMLALAATSAAAMAAALFIV
jgi:hypothetical protein